VRGSMRENKSNFLLSALGTVKPPLQSVPEAVLVHTEEQPSMVQIRTGGREPETPTHVNKQQMEYVRYISKLFSFFFPCIYNFSFPSLLTSVGEAFHKLFAIMSTLTHEKYACICKCCYIYVA
jgi:hypothetical protein